MTRDNFLPNLAALCTIVLWGITFISTKILLRAWTPLEILFIRFILGWVALCFIAKARIPVYNKNYEVLFMLAGASGVTLYFLLENEALTLTMAANVSVLVSTTPFFTGICAWLLLKAPKPGLHFYIGFALAICGVILISFGGKEVSLNPLGDFLALLASLAWAFYSIFTRKLATAGFDSLAATRRIFFYGVLFMLPVTLFENFSLKMDLFIQPVYLVNYLFLGFGASALCFAVWTWCVKRLGATQASIWIYLVPVVAIIAAHLILDERITGIAWLGIFLTLSGLLISEKSAWSLLARIIKQK